MTSKKKNDCISTHVGHIFFKSKQTSSTISPKLTEISPNLPEKNEIKTWPPKKRKKVFDFGCYFCKIKAHTAIVQTFSKILPKFPQILPGFKVILSGFSPNQKFWGWGCTSASYTSA